jgi:hypothetical protein
MDPNGTTLTGPEPKMIVLSVVNMIFSAAGTIGNLGVCFIILANRDLQIITNYFIFSLAVADLLVCTIAQPMYVAYILGFQDGAFQSIRRAFTFVSVLASVSNLWAVTLDRFLAISSPLKYPQRLNVKRANLLLFVIWTLALTLGVTAAFVRYVRVFVNFFTIIMIACIFPLYIRIFIVARRHARLIIHQLSYFNTMQFAAVQIRKERENIAAKTVGTVLLIFALCWMPLEILPFAYRSNPEQILSAFVWVNTLALCSSAINPLVYSWKMESFRRKVKRVLRLSLVNGKECRPQSHSIKNGDEETNV